MKGVVMQKIKFSPILGLLAFMVSMLISQTGCESIDRAWEEQRVQREVVEVPERERVGRPRTEHTTPDAINRGFGAQDPWGGAMRARPMRPEGTAARPTGDRGDTADILNAGFGPPLFEADERDLFPMEPAAQRRHEVQRGESLWSIARSYGVPFAQLLEANQMTRDTRLRVGQEIVVPGDGEFVPAPGVSGPATATGARYTVVRGDTLSHIAQRHGTSVAAIRQANNLRSDTIRIGQELIIPGADQAIAPTTRERTTTAPTRTTTGTHVVRAGETPAQIARQYGMRTDELMELNQITDPRRMRIGQELRVRDTAGADAASAETESAKLPSTRPSDPGLSPEARRPAQVERERVPETDPRAPVIRDDGPPVRIIESDEVDFDDFGFGEDDLLDLADDLPTIETERVGD